MGLGKTLQVVTLTHTLLSHDELGFTKGMVLCPLNVCLNWVDEFMKWTPSDSVAVYELSQIKVSERRVQRFNLKPSNEILFGHDRYRA